MEKEGLMEKSEAHLNNGLSSLSNWAVGWPHGWQGYQEGLGLGASGPDALPSASHSKLLRCTAK